MTHPLLTTSFSPPSRFEASRTISVAAHQVVDEVGVEHEWLDVASELRQQPLLGGGELDLGVHVPDTTEGVCRDEVTV